MTVEKMIECPHCGNDTFVAEVVPESAWQPNGAYWTFQDSCQMCDKEINLQGEIGTEIDVI